MMIFYISNVISISYEGLTTFYIFFSFTDIPEKGWKIDDGFLSNKDVFKCRNGTILSKLSYVKDTDDDCGDGSDEKGE